MFIIEASTANPKPQCWSWVLIFIFLKSVFGLVSSELGAQHNLAWNVSSSGLKLGMHQALAELFFINKFIVKSQMNQNPTTYNGGIAHSQALPGAPQTGRKREMVGQPMH
ncbi:hypothetical protein ACB092_07G046900 [Castanea dentata]